MEEVLKVILSNLCTKPFEISRIDGKYAVVFEVRIDGSDAPRVLGKKGTIANAIRTILYAINREDKRIVFQVCV